MRRLLPLALVLAACSGGGDASATPPTSSPSTTAASTTVPSTTTTGVPAATTTTGAGAVTATTLAEPVESVLYDHWQGSFTYGDGLRIDVHAPDDRSNHPVAVTIHGGGWYGGRLDSMGDLADGLAARGFVVFNATYRTLARGGSYPSMVEDVACAVDYARRHALDYSTDDSRVTVIGHSAGAHLASLVAFAPDRFGAACPDADVDAFVGLAGSYDVETYGFLLEPFFGVPLTDDPELWAEGNPSTHVIDIDPDLDVLVVHGTADELIPVSMSETFFLAVEATAGSARLEIIENAGHGEVNSSRVVGDLIADFVASTQ